MTADERPYVWLPRFGIMLKELLEGPECQDIQDGMSTVLESSEAPEGEPMHMPMHVAINSQGDLVARVFLDLMETYRLREEGYSADVIGCVPLVPVRHYGLLRVGPHLDDPIGGSHIISNTGTVSELARLEDGQATITYGSGYGPTYPMILGSCDGISDRGTLTEGLVCCGRSHQRDPCNVLSTGDSRVLWTSRTRDRREVTTAGVSSLGNQEGLLGEHAGHTRGMVSLEVPYDFRADIGIVGNLDRVMISPPSSSGRERVRMVGIGEDRWVMPSMDNNPLYGGYGGVGGSVGVMGRVDVGHDYGAAVKGTPCTIGMAASNTATTTVIPTTSSVCCYMLSIGKAIREGDLPNSSTSVGRGMQETAPLLLEELNDARLNHTGGSSSSCYDKETPQESPPKIREIRMQWRKKRIMCPWMDRIRIKVSNAGNGMGEGGMD
ncbi:hypothetical protein FOZ60_013213 [Perkinsus olseni]|uniref:Uncharacterized protein n=1 Tax=Perkinsus olseni TaxID=32597 RepID=A0A7J6NA53_PEROL|nr:hypothetical protein FOZ60_013213 [Perkinsus olseni]